MDGIGAGTELMIMGTQTKKPDSIPVLGVGTPNSHTKRPTDSDFINVLRQLLAALLGATAMATWHAALFMEMEKIHEPGFPLTWPDWLQVQTPHFISWTNLM